MELTVFESNRPIGTLRWEPQGLYWHYHCKITHAPSQLRRLFVLSGRNGVYIGIPDRFGILEGKIAKKHIPKAPDTAIVTDRLRTPWIPWRGELDGVEVTNAFLRPEGEGFRIALTPEEAVKFPAWAEYMETERLSDGAYSALTLNADGQLPLIETETGGLTNETMDRRDFTYHDPLDLVPDFDHSSGAEQGWQADCPDL